MSQTDHQCAWLYAGRRILLTRIIKVMTFGASTTLYPVLASVPSLMLCRAAMLYRNATHSSLTNKRRADVWNDGSDGGGSEAAALERPRK